MPLALFQHVPCNTAEDLLNVLTPHSGRELWARVDQDGWIFRGQAEAVWPLRPSALRKNAFRDFFPTHAAGRQYSLAERLELEGDVVRRFASYVSNFGFEVPGDSPLLRDADHAIADDGVDFPHITQRPLYALAQHYLVPTRLLDWTRRPLFAAYFAARSVVDPHFEPDPESDRRLAVWVVQHGYVNVVLRERDPGAVVITVPTVSNPNLHAQMGVFTLVRFKNAPSPQRDIPDLDAFFAGEYAATQVPAGNPTPLLFKFTLPHSQAPRLLHFLDLQYVNAASVYPGRHSIASYMREGALKTVCYPGDSGQRGPA